MALKTPSLLASGRVTNDARFNVVVVGAGPAGSFCAKALAASGAKVLLVERAAFGRDKVCGEGLMPRGKAALARAGLSSLVDNAPAFEGIAMHAAGKTFVGRFSTGAGCGVRRTALDAALAEAASKAGAEVRFQSTVRSLDLLRAPSRAGCVVETDGGRVLADVVVLADGGRSRLQRAFARRQRNRNGDGRVGVVAHAQTGLRSNLVHAHLGKGWQVVLTPVPGGLLSVAALVEKWRAAELKAGVTNWLLARLRDLEIEVDEIGEAHAVPLVGGVKTKDIAQDGLILLGDAAGAVDPIVGCGISLACESAERAAAAILRALDHGGPRASAFRDYARHKRQVLRAPRAAARFALFAGRNSLVERSAAQLMQHVPRVFETMVSMIGD